jgi:hypothetical protein
MAERGDSNLRRSRGVRAASRNPEPEAKNLYRDDLK